MTGNELQQLTPAADPALEHDEQGVDLLTLFTWLGQGKRLLATVTLTVAVLALVAGLLWP